MDGESRQVDGAGRPAAPDERETMKRAVRKNNLATTHPELAVQLVDTDPTTVTFGSHKKVDWKCGLGHTYPMMIKNRVRGSKSTCTVCSGQLVVPGDNDMATTHPKLARQLVDTDPTTVVAGTNHSLWWRCSLGHHWSALGSSRVRGDGCPLCNNKRLHPGINDMATTHPSLARELVTDPTTVFAGTGTRLLWQCSQGHRYRRSGNHRLLGSGCGYCARKRVIPGETDLATTDPALAAQLVGTDPTTILSGYPKKLRWRCDAGHEWSASPNNRTSRGSGCPSCNIGGYDPNQPGYLYLMERDGEQQVGISGDLNRRVRRHRGDGWSRLVDTAGPMSGDEAAAIEKRIKAWLRLNVGTLPGSSESWSTANLEVRSLDELIALATQSGNKKRPESPCHPRLRG